MTDPVRKDTYMAKDVTFKLNLKGLNEFMKSSEVQAALDDAGEAVKKAAGDGYDTSSKKGRYIGFSNVFPDDDKAKRDNLKNNTLLKALQASGLSMKK